MLGDLNRSTDRDRSFGLLTPDDSFTKDIRFVIPTKESELYIVPRMASYIITVSCRFAFGVLD